MQILVTRNNIHLKQRAGNFSVHGRYGFGFLSKSYCGFVVKDLIDQAEISQDPSWMRHNSVAVEFMAQYRSCEQMYCLQVHLLNIQFLLFYPSASRIMSRVVSHDTHCKP